MDKDTNNHICEAFGCYEESTKKIKVSAGKLGTITLSICDKCLYKFKGEKNEES
jgi:hypothetical protein